MFSVVMVTLLYHQCFAIILLLRGNSDAINQSYLRNFLAYIMKKDINHLALTIQFFCGAAELISTGLVCDYARIHKS